MSEPFKPLLTAERIEELRREWEECWTPTDEEFYALMDMAKASLSLPAPCGTFESLLDTYLQAHDDATNYSFNDSIYAGLKADEAKARAAVIASARPEVRAIVPILVRPMLVRGQLATDKRGPLILINSEEEPPHEQVVSLWHEVLHLIGMTDEFLTEEYAMRLADAAPDILRRLAHNINVPDETTPSPRGK